MLFIPVTIFAEDFEGTIQKIGNCKMSKGNKAYCQSIIVKMKNGKKAHAEVTFGTSIISENKGILSNSSKIDEMFGKESHVEVVNDFDKIFRNNLKPGVKVHVKLSNSKDSGTYADQVLIK